MKNQGYCATGFNSKKSAHWQDILWLMYFIGNKADCAGSFGKKFITFLWPTSIRL